VRTLAGRYFCQDSGRNKRRVLTIGEPQSNETRMAAPSNAVFRVLVAQDGPGCPEGA
jgi:hypothetical protein